MHSVYKVRTAHSIPLRNEAQFEDVFITATNNNNNNNIDNNNNFNITEDMDTTSPPTPQSSITTTSTTSTTTAIGTGSISNAEPVSISSIASSASLSSSSSVNNTASTSVTMEMPLSIDIESLVAQKQNQLAYFRKQQILEQQKQRQLLFHQQQLSLQKQRHYEKENRKLESQGTGDKCHTNALRLHQIQENKGQAVISSECRLSIDTHVAQDVKQKTSSSAVVITTDTDATHNSNDRITSVITTTDVDHTSTNRVDLVDDVWRLVFYILASDCKNLGRSMQVNRRFYNLIANDAVLWKLAYNLTVSGSIFFSQKSSHSPVEAKVEPHHQNPSHEGSFVNVDQDISSSSELKCAGNPVEDMNEDGPFSPTAMITNQSEPRQPSRWNNGVEDHYHHPIESRRSSMTMSPALQIPSPLILPHHRRIAQNISSPISPSFHTSNDNNNEYENNNSEITGAQPIVDQSMDLSSSSGMSGLFSSSSSSLSTSSSSLHSNNNTQNYNRTFSGKTPASTPSSPCITSFQPMSTASSTIISQVISSSTTPLAAIHNHIPTTTLLHRHPAIYWKNQVVEWLEREKLRCLRLGLFWGFNAAGSRAHGRNLRKHGDPQR